MYAGSFLALHFTFCLYFPGLVFDNRVKYSILFFMKYFVAILILFSAFAVYAQEMDTTYVVNEQGETIGLIHEKGAISDTDSSAIYLDLIETYTERGNAQRSSGKAMMLGGGLTFGVGTAVMIAGLANMNVPLRTPRLAALTARATLRVATPTSTTTTVSKVTVANTPA